MALHSLHLLSTNWHYLLADPVCRQPALGDCAEPDQEPQLALQLSSTGRAGCQLHHAGLVVCNTGADATW